MPTFLSSTHPPVVALLPATLAVHDFYALDLLDLLLAMVLILQVCSLLAFLALLACHQVQHMDRAQLARLLH
jgi:type IV secretory pathway VirB3-like protein